MAENTKDILETELSEQEASQLMEAIQAWKEEYATKLEAEAEARIQARIDELDEENNIWREEVAEAYSDKFLSALDEMREDVKAEVLAESMSTDPVHKVVDEIIKLVSPLMNEEYMENTYASEYNRLLEELKAYKEKEALREGAEALDELLENYDEQYKKMLKKIIGEGDVEYVTNRYESIVSTLSEDDDEEDDFEDDFEDDSDFDIDEEDDFEDEDFEDEEFNEDFEDGEFSTINEDEENYRFENAPQENKMRSSMLRLLNN